MDSTQSLPLLPSEQEFAVRIRRDGIVVEVATSRPDASALAAVSIAVHVDASVSANRDYNDMEGLAKAIHGAVRREIEACQQAVKLGKEDCDPFKAVCGRVGAPEPAFQYRLRKLLAMLQREASPRVGVAGDECVGPGGCSAS